MQHGSLFLGERVQYWSENAREPGLLRADRAAREAVQDVRRQGLQLRLRVRSEDPGALHSSAVGELPPPAPCCYSRDDLPGLELSAVAFCSSVAASPLGLA
jgi:hypothetical protein